MPSSTTVMRVLFATAAVLVAGAAVVTASFSEGDSKTGARVGVTTLDEMPLALGPGVFGRAGAPKDELVAATRPKALDVGQNWSPSGLMGDAKAKGTYMQFVSHYTRDAHSRPDCIRLAYDPGPTGWAGQYWLNSMDNLGSEPGADLRAYRRLTFWAKGENGGERVEFKAGAIDATRKLGVEHKDSFSASLGTVTLDGNWQQYQLDLHGADLSSVIGGFAWVATENDNPDGLVFYLDDIQYE